MGSLLVSQVAPGGLVGKRNLQPRGFVTGQTSCTYRIKYPVAVGASNLRLQFPNWTTQPAGTGDTPTGNTLTLGAVYVEYGGTLYPVTFGGSSSRDIPSGDLITSDPVSGLTVSAGMTLYVRTYVTVASGGQWPSMYGAVAYPDEVSRPGSNLANGTGDLTGTGQSVSNLYGPSQIFGTLTAGQPTYGVAFFGDSILAGVNDSFSDESQVGYIQRLMYGSNRPYITVALPGESAAQVLSGQASKRIPLVGEHAQYFYNEYGINDLQGGATLAQLQARILSIANVAANDPGVVKRLQQTLGPKSSSTDNWATTANQTTDGINANRVQFNDWVRDGMPTTNGVAVATGTSGAVRAGDSGHPYTGFVEVADLCETARNSGIWKANYTTDGLHPGPNGNQQIAAGLSPATLFPDTSASNAGSGSSATLPRDASSPAIRSSPYQGAGASQAWASNSFSPPAGSLLVVTAQATQSYNNTWNTPTITDSAGLTWTRLGTQADSTFAGPVATVSIFYAVTPAAQSNMTVTVTQSLAGSGQTITFSSVAVGVFTGFNTGTPIALLSQGTSTAANLSVSVTPASGGSGSGLFIGANNAAASSAATSAGTGEYLTDETHTGTSFAVAHYGSTNQPAIATAAQTLDLVTGGSSPRWQYMAWEVRSAAANVPAGSASGGIAVAGSASGTTAKAGAASGMVTVAGSASGAQSPSGTATGAVTAAGSASGSTVNAGSATGSIPVTGAASGSANTSGSTAGTVLVAGSASGQTAYSGASAGSVTVSGSVSGQTSTFGSASGAVPVSGSASGTSTPSGTTSGAVTVAGSASGSTQPSGSTSAVVQVSGQASGAISPSGSGGGAVTVGGSASGSKTSTGSATGAVSVTSSASGSAVTSGSASGQVTASGSASGFAPVVGGNSGGASGTVTVAGQASGSTVTQGSASGSVGVTGSASGAAQASGSATGSIGTSGSASGYTDASGSATGLIDVTALASGQTTTSGTTSGLISLTGSASGLTPIVGGNSGTATGLINITGTASGAATATGTATGLITVSGQASGGEQQTGTLFILRPNGMWESLTLTRV